MTPSSREDVSSWMGDALADGKLRTKTALVLAASWPDETKEIQTDDPRDGSKCHDVPHASARVNNSAGVGKVLYSRIARVESRELSRDALVTCTRFPPI